MSITNKDLFVYWVSHFYKIVIFIAVWLFCVQLVFSFLQNVLADRTKTLITSQIETTINTLNYDGIIRTFNNLESNGVFTCLNVSMTENSSGIKDIFRSDENCFTKLFSLSGSYIEMTVSLPTNKVWNISFNLANEPSFLLVVWMARLSGISLILLLYFYLYLKNKNRILSLEIEKRRILDKKILLARLAHDIRSPLSVLNLLSTGVSFKNSDFRQIFFSSLNKINSIAEDLLEKNIDTKSLTFSYISLKHEMDHLIKEKSIEFQSNVTFKFQSSINDSDDIYLCGSKHDTLRILSNLLNNSYEARINGVCEIFIRLYSKGKYILISVEDNGAGIDSDSLKKLTKVTFTNKSDGHGLGLLSANTYLESIGGYLEIKSTLNKGTEVCIYIPTI